MKKITQILAVLYLLLNGFVAIAQYNISVIDTTADGIIKFATVQTQDSKSEKIDSKSFLKNILKAEKETEFYLYKVTEDDLGMTHEKYQQTFNGIKVEFGEFIVHKDKTGNIVSINGDIVPVPSTFKITPNIEFDNALSNAATSKRIKEYHVQDLPEEKSVEKAITKKRR